MPEAQNILLFMLAAFTLNITPGPDMLYVITRSVSQGRAAGIVSAFGITAGCFIHMLAVALGMAGLLIVLPLAYEIIKYTGAAYLIYLGIRQLFSRQHLNDASEVGPNNLRAIFLQGLLTNVLNPKVALFFLAFLPQFVNHQQGSDQGGIALQIILLGLLFNISGTLVNITVACAADYGGARFRASLNQPSLLRRLSGLVFIGLGIRLALLERR